MRALRLGSHSSRFAYLPSVCLCVPEQELFSLGVNGSSRASSGRMDGQGEERFGTHTAPQTIVSYSSSSSPKGILNNWQYYLRKHEWLKRNRGEVWL